MSFINYSSNIIIPAIITIIIIYGVIENVKVFDCFLEGAKEGVEIVINLLPTLIGLFFAIGILRSSGVLDFIIKILEPLTKILRIPKEIMPLALLRPISRKRFSCNRHKYNEHLWCR